MITGDGDERHGFGSAAAMAAAVVGLLLLVGVVTLGVDRTVTGSPEEPASAPRLVASAPDATVVIRPSGRSTLYDADEGELVVARVRDFPPRASGALGFCHEHGCEQVVPILTDNEGKTDVAYTLASECHGGGCALVVEVGAVRGSVATVFGPRPAPVVARPTGPRPDVPASRVLAGLFVALLLGGVAIWLVRSTDWQAPTEAATPAMDAADLAT